MMFEQGLKGFMCHIGGYLSFRVIAFIVNLDSGKSYRLDQVADYIELLEEPVFWDLPMSQSF